MTHLCPTEGPAQGAHSLYVRVEIFGTTQAPPMSILKSLPSAATRAKVVKLQAQIFGENYNPQRIRNGNKILRQPLRGPEYLSWYGDNDAMPTFKDFKKWFPELDLVDPREAERQRMVIDRKKRNKGAPKKKKS